MADSVAHQIARIQGRLSLVEMKIARLHLRDDITGKNRRAQLVKARRKVAIYLDALDGLRHPEA